MKNHVRLSCVAALALGLLCTGCHNADSQSGSTPPPSVGSAPTPPGAAPALSPAAAAAQANGAGLGARNHATGTP